MKHTLLGILFWLAMAFVTLAVIAGCVLLFDWIATRICARVDWLLVKKVVTWAVWMWLLLSIARFFNAKARKP